MWKFIILLYILINNFYNIKYVIKLLLIFQSNNLLMYDMQIERVTFFVS